MSCRHTFGFIFAVALIALGWSISATSQVVRSSDDGVRQWKIIAGEVLQIEVVKDFYKIVVSDTISGNEYLLVSERPVGNDYFYNSSDAEINRADNIQTGKQYRFLIAKKHPFLEELIGVSIDIMSPIPDYFGSAGQPFWPYVTPNLKRLKYVPEPTSCN